MPAATQPQTIHQRKYRQLLISLVVNFSTAPLQGNMIGQLIGALSFLYAMITILRTFALDKKTFLFFIGIAILAFGLAAMAQLDWYRPGPFFPALVQGIYALYLGAAAYLILQDIIHCQDITADTIRGGICVYLLIGILWSLLYGIVASFDPEAFSRPILMNREATYYSFVTLTNLGTGDILPISPIAKMLTNLEAIIGQLYPAVLISILVTGYASGKSK